MNFTFQPMTQKQSEEIADWQYEGDYAFYDMVADEDDLQEFLNPLERKDFYFAVTERHDLIGFYCFKETAAGIIDIGLGMKPGFTGKGRGHAFFRAGLDFAIARYQPKKFTLAVAAFNERAIAVYKKAGFQPDEVFLQKTNGGHYKFIKMKLALEQQQA
ncbi:ribosomal-protein-alanine N-acetyltransferase [Planomicrobium koreense]|uniref:Ribosomal-protein-alanine N-acetyltransferase n=1 Tax=Planococcus koreensis TaxID=112331 RepID=A0A7W8CU96_9BACL|nr:GNAT family N-acetyltransferase [Planococcus koreensis]MBB5180959.1 ribosomal-protein-alanine N-acetyltransferase [Planococcus koreensis]